METNNNNIINTQKKTRKKPCPRGTRYNKKTEQCEPFIKQDNKSLPESVEPIPAPVEPELVEQKISPQRKSNKKTRNFKI